MKIIGVELRISDPYGGPEKELLLVPLDVEIPDESDWQMRCTIHTEAGDVTIGQATNGNNYPRARSIQPFRR